MRRVTESIALVFPEDLENYEGWLHEMNEKHGLSLTPETVLEWASKFGTTMHEWALQNKEPEKKTKIMKECYKHWEKFIKDHDVKIIKTEQPILYKELYHGTFDALVEVDGLKVLLDLKMWECWKWELLKQEIPTELKQSSVKLAKTNLQTYMYKQGAKDMVDARAVVSINPLGYQFKVFRTTPQQKFNEIIEFLKKENEDINF